MGRRTAGGRKEEECSPIAGRDARKGTWGLQGTRKEVNHAGSVQGAIAYRKVHNKVEARS